eukprot:15352512-Ditylum_brightwellii.AAC.1
MLARFQSDLRRPHYNAIKRVGAYTKENSDDPNSVQSISGCVIMYSNFPITWFSRLQNKIALSTTEAEYIALSTAARDVLPIRNQISEIAPVMKINIAKLDIKCIVFEDNRGTEELTKVYKIRLRTKDIGVECYHFRQIVKDKILHMTSIDTKDQRADIFTKALPHQSFENL